MKLKDLILRSSLFASGVLLLFSCNQENPEKIVALSSNRPAEEKRPNPFPFYKNISIRPGLNFEVLSWGKGKDSVGGYLVLMSDSVKNDYKSLSAERKGIITDVWNMDMDNDGNPELYIELLSKKNVLDLNVYEYSRNGFQKINFPPLSSSMKKYYAGNDKFQIKDGVLFRTFPAVNPADTTKKPGAAMKTLRYKLNGSSFSVEEVKEKP